MTLALCLSLGTYILPQQARAADSYQTFDTSQDYYLWLKDDSGSRNYRWNANASTWKSVIHLDIPSGSNCAFHFTDAGDGYYGIKYRGCSYYIDTEGNNSNENEVLHQYYEDLKPLPGL